MSSKKKKTKQIKKNLKSIRGVERKEHFAQGKSLQQWRGLHHIHSSKSKKRHSRNSDKQKAIRDSDDQD